MTKPTERANRYGQTEKWTDPNHRKALLLKIDYKNI